jgi:hypothetical protein
MWTEMFMHHFFRAQTYDKNEKEQSAQWVPIHNLWFDLWEAMCALFPEVTAELS